MCDNATYLDRTMERQRRHRERFELYRDCLAAMLGNPWMTGMPTDELQVEIRRTAMQIATDSMIDLYANGKASE